MVLKGKDREPACKLSTIINRQFLTVRMIGKGSYGVVYEVVRLDSPSTRLACKAELAVAHNNLKTEWDLMKLLMDNKSKHNIIGVELGSERNFNYIIMQLVGPSLADLRRTLPKKAEKRESVADKKVRLQKFSLYTTSVCSIQCFDSLVELQKLGYIHRDVKPSNFAIGPLGSEEEKLIYILDFGLCRNLFKNKELRKPRMKAPFRGTIVYCSMNIHQRMEPGRHDDFWSLLYMMIEFHLGNLPWDNMNKEEAKKAKEKSTDELLNKCPAEFKVMRSYLLTLSYSREPDYVMLRTILCQLMHVNRFNTERPLDWQAGGKYGDLFKPRATAFTRKASKTKVVLSELLNIPKAGSKLLTEQTFAQFEEPPRDQSVSHSDDTIIDKEGPPPAPRPASKPAQTPKRALVEKPLNTVPPLVSPKPPPPPPAAPRPSLPHTPKPTATAPTVFPSPKTPVLAGRPSQVAVAAPTDAPSAPETHKESNGVLPATKVARTPVSPTRTPPKQPPSAKNEVKS